MKACSCKALFISLFLILICPNVSFAANSIDPGMLMYKAGHLEQAKQYYEAEIAANPKNANAHYMLANVLLELKRTGDAQEEYRQSEVLDPDSSTGQYSRLALIRLGGNPIADANSKQTMKDSVQTISKEVGEEEQKAQAECDAKVRHIYEVSDERVQQLEDEMKERIAENGQAVYARVPVWSRCLISSAMGRIVKTYDPEPANEAIREEYNPQIDKIKLQARQEADKIIASYKEKATALEDSALTLDKSYVNNKQTSSVSLIPAGTNMYLRNYQTTDSPSGSPVPVMAAPPKLLPGIQPSNKSNY